MSNTLPFPTTISESNDVPSISDDKDTEIEDPSRASAMALASARSTPGRSWAIGNQWIFLESNCAAYWKAKAEKTLPAFYEKIISTWVEKGLGPLDEVGCTKLPSKDLSADVYTKQVRKRAKVAVKNWFKNHTKIRSSGAGRKKLKRFLSKGKTRKLQPVFAYSRLYYDCPERKIREIVDTRFDEYVAGLCNGQKPLGKATFRLQVLRKLLDKEPEDVKKKVEQYCVNVASPSYNEIDEFKAYPPEEAQRLANALSRRCDIDAIPELMETFLDTIFAATGYRGFIGLSGPDAHANNLTTNLTITTSGVTQNSNLTLKQFSSCYNQFVNDIESWGRDCITNEEREALSMEPRVQPAVTIDIVEATVYNIEEAAEKTTVSKAKVKPKKKRAPSSSDESSSSSSDNESSGDAGDGAKSGRSDSIINNMYQPKSVFFPIDDNDVPFSPYSTPLDDLQLTSAVAPAQVNSTNANPSLDPALFAQPDIDNPSLETSQLTPPRQVGIDPPPSSPIPVNAPDTNSHEAETSPIPCTYTAPSPSQDVANEEHVESTSSVNQPVTDVSGPTAELRSLDEPETVADCTASANENRQQKSLPSIVKKSKTNKRATRKGKTSGSTKNKRAAPPVGDPKWVNETKTQLRSYLRGPHALEAVERWAMLEELLEYKCTSEELILENAPACLREYLLSTCPNTYEPKREPGLLNKQFKIYWSSLQPQWRCNSEAWPPTQTNPGHPESSDWHRLLKGGPSGVVLILKLMGFWAKMAWSISERRDFETAMTEVNWVLGEMIKNLNGGSILGKRRRS